VFTTSESPVSSGRNDCLHTHHSVGCRDSRAPPDILVYIKVLSISNVAVCFEPIEVLPHIYRYGYAMPFYNVSGAVRTILFGTKNEFRSSLWNSYRMVRCVHNIPPNLPVVQEE
ncbi:hypothetical protein BDZ89DRAFT_1251160, partial [Hymenopellis radicata]